MLSVAFVDDYPMSEYSTNRYDCVSEIKLGL